MATLRRGKTAHCGKDRSCRAQEDPENRRGTCPGNHIFLVAAELYLKKELEKKAPDTLSKVKRLHQLANAGIGNRPIDAIQPVEILAVLRKHEAAGHRETAKRVRSAIGEVFRYAVQTGRATNDPTWALRGAIAAPTPVPRPAIIEPAEFGKLLKAIDGYSSFVVKSALQLTGALVNEYGNQTVKWSRP